MPGFVCESAARCLRVNPHGAQMSREFFDQAEQRGIFVDPDHAEAHWYVGQVENHARYLRVAGNRTMEDMDIDEADLQQLPDELLDANLQSCAASSRETMLTLWVFGSAPRVPGHVLE